MLKDPNKSLDAENTEENFESTENIKRLPYGLAFSVFSCFFSVFSASLDFELGGLAL